MWSTLRISRNFSITNVLEGRTARKKFNPGVGHQITALDDVPASMEEDPEGFGDMETDFANVHHMHKDYEHEKVEQRDRVRQFVVKSKYFPAMKLPNFLTYAEKEQMRILHNREEEQWTVEALAESFPASCEIVRKVLKSNWKVSSLKRIQEHDKKVTKNWQLFEKGEFKNQLPPELQEHLSKFINRQNLTKQQTNVPQRVDPKPISKQFSSLLRVGQKQENVDQVKALESKKQEITTTPPLADEDTYLLDKVRSKKYVRLEDLNKSKLKSQLIKLSSKTDLDLSAHNNNINSTGVVLDQSLTFQEKFATNEVVIGEADMKRFEISSVKDRIYIPRKLRREGATYRIDDCYYDDDGEFLYRVPGMTRASERK